MHTYEDEFPFEDEGEPLASRKAPRSPLDSMTVAAYETERAVSAALEEFDPTGEIDILANRYGAQWSVRPITTRAATWLVEWQGEEPVEPTFSAYCLPVRDEDFVELHDALVDAGLRIA
jgi:hypothetical protein